MQVVQPLLVFFTFHSLSFSWERVLWVQALIETYWLCVFIAVQHECIPQAILGMDVLCQAKSGMGKTAVFVLATLQQLEPVTGQVIFTPWFVKGVISTEDGVGISPSLKLYFFCSILIKIVFFSHPPFQFDLLTKISVNSVLWLSSCQNPDERREELICTSEFPLIIIMCSLQ